jgi:hypothetical protein
VGYIFDSREVRLEVSSVMWIWIRACLQIGSLEVSSVDSRLYLEWKSSGLRVGVCLSIADDSFCVWRRRVGMFPH